MHESVRDTHGSYWRPNLLPDDRLGFRLAQLSHPVQYMAPDLCLLLLRFVAARTKAVSERALVPEEKILDGALSALSALSAPVDDTVTPARALAPDFANRLKGRVPLRHVPSAPSKGTAPRRGGITILMSAVPTSPSSSYTNRVS